MAFGAIGCARDRRLSHVDAGLQKPGQLVDVRPERVVATGVGLQRDQRVDVVGGRHPCGFGPAGQLGGVDAELVGAVRVDPDQFHVVAPDDGVQRPPSDVAGGPLDDAKWPVSHGVSSMSVKCAVDTIGRLFTEVAGPCVWLRGG